MKKNKSFWLGIIFSAFVIGYVLLELDWEAVRHTFSNLKWGWLSLGFSLYLINYTIRTLRFKILLQLERLNFRQLMGATNLYGMYLYLMPAKSGEISLPVILKRNFNVSITESAATLIVVRFLDFATITLFIPLTLLVYRDRLPTWFLFSALIFCSGVFIGGIILVWLLRSKTIHILDHPVLTKYRWAQSIAHFLNRLLKQLKLIDQRRQYWRLWLLTIGIWLLVYATFYMIVLSMGFTYTYIQMMVVSILMVPLTLLPFQGFANLGTHEIGWVAAFSIFGQNADSSLAIAVGSHIIMLLFVLLLGLLGVFLLKSNRSVSP